MTEDALTPVEVPEPAEEPALPVIEDGKVFAMLRQLRSYRVQEAWLKEAASTLSKELALLLEKGALFTDPEGHTIEALVVRSDGKVTGDLNRLKTVDPLAFQALTKPQLDTAKLRRALKAGTLSAEAIACFGTTPKDPHMRMTDLTAPTQEEDPDA